MHVIVRTGRNHHYAWICEVSLSLGELFNLHAILQICPASSSLDARTVNNVQYQIFQDAAAATGLFKSQTKAHYILNEAIDTLKTPTQLRHNCGFYSFNCSSMNASLHHYSFGTFFKTNHASIVFYATQTCPKSLLITVWIILERCWKNRADNCLNIIYSNQQHTNGRLNMNYRSGLHVHENLQSVLTLRMQISMKSNAKFSM